MLTWRAQNAFLIALATVVLSGAWFVPSSLQQHLQSTSHLEPSLRVSMPIRITAPSGSEIGTVDKALIERVAAMELHRMRRPQPLPPPEPIVSSTPANTIVEPLFSGTLLGIIEDNDPSYCFAILQTAPNRIRFVSFGQPINEDGSGPVLKEINHDSVTLARGENTQVIPLKASQ